MDLWRIPRDELQTDTTKPRVPSHASHPQHTEKRTLRHEVVAVISALRSVSCQTVLMSTPPINCGQVWVQDKSASDRIHS